MTVNRKRLVATTAIKRAEKKRKAKRASFVESCQEYSRAKMALFAVNPMSMTDEMHDKIAKGAGL